jgi:transposase InsO family protein
VAADDNALRLRIREITETRIHYGYRRVHVMLRREGWRDNHKRIYRLYCEQGLSLRLKRPRRNKSAQRRQPQPQGLYPNHVWGMGFVSDAWSDGRRLRLLTVIDLYTRECLGICVGKECLNENGFMSLVDARCKIEAWRIHYNQSRPHSALGWMTPSEFAEKSAGCQNMQPD